jgi:methylmalonyl-CoA mutase cobalamin-binding subunit
MTDTTQDNRRAAPADQTDRGETERGAGLASLVVEQVIPRLVDNCRHATAGRTPGSTHVDTLAALAIGRDALAADAHVTALIADGLSPHDALMALIGPAAHRLGDFWRCDTADFAEVAIGAARLVRIARRLGLEAERNTPLDAPRALIASPKVERHAIGALIVAQVFRTAGWRVTGLPGGSEEEILAEAAGGGYDLIGLSIGSERATEGLGKLIARIRARCGAAVALGGGVFARNPGRAAALGADFVATDADEALEKTRKHLSQRKKRNMH